MHLSGDVHRFVGVLFERAVVHLTIRASQSVSLSETLKKWLLPLSCLWCDEFRILGTRMRAAIQELRQVDVEVDWAEAERWIVPELSETDIDVLVKVFTVGGLGDARNVSEPRFREVYVVFCMCL